MKPDKDPLIPVEIPLPAEMLDALTLLAAKSVAV
jgi:hypothetical protein